MGTAGARLVFTHAADAADGGAAALELFPHAELRPQSFVPTGPTVYVAHDAAHLEAYEPWFPGLQVRVRACLRHRPLDPGGALYLPVAFDAWAVALEGPGSLGAALEAARCLCVKTVVVPAFGPEAAAAVRAGLGLPYRRWHDRILVVDRTLKDEPDARGQEAAHERVGG